MKQNITFLATFLLMPQDALYATEAPMPNILFCIWDDAAFPHMSAYGCRWVKTPGFDRVAREGLLFNNAYTPNAKCAPSRACVLTGRNSWQLEAGANHGGFFPANYLGFMEALGGQGYSIGFTGKGWAPGDPGKVDGKERLLTGLDYNNKETSPPTDGISTTDYAANFQDFIDAKPAGQPFCFWFGGREPHRQYEYGSGVKKGGGSLSDIDHVPAYWPDNEIVRNDMLDYAYEIEYIDQHLVRAMELLEKAGELENTIIVVTSDNGMPFPRDKGTSYERSLHMPLAIRWGAGIKKPGREVEGYVSFIDFAPTFLDAAGVSPEKSGMKPLQGSSLLPIFRGESDWVKSEAANYIVFGQERHDVGRPDDVGYPVRGLIQDGVMYFRNYEPGRWPMCDPITGYMNTDGSPTKTLILAHNRQGINHWMWELNFGRRPAEEMYDLHKGSDCMVNLVDDPAYRAQRVRMERILLTELKSQADPRIDGNGYIFDQYPHSKPAVRDFYNRVVLNGEKLVTDWVNPDDAEKPDFDPERPLKPKASNTKKIIKLFLDPASKIK